MIGGGGGGGEPKNCEIDTVHFSVHPSLLYFIYFVR